jgi:hypothetical protein
VQETKNGVPSSNKGPNNRQKLTPVWRAAVEMGFIIFLFYANLLMGEFTRTNGWKGKSLAFAIRDMLTVEDFAIAIGAALIGYLAIEYLRKKF